MDFKPKCEILEFNEDNEIQIKKEHSLDKPGDLEQIINIIEEWINQQPHFRKKKFPKKYLENSVIAAKGSMERAKVHIEKLCTLRTMYPILFQEHDVRKLAASWEGYYIQSILPKLTDSNCRVYISKFLKDGTKSQMMFNIYRASIMILEYIKLHDCNDGIYTIVDLRGISLMDLITEVNVSDLRNILAISTEGYALRVKGVHFISSSSAVEVLTKMFKSVVGAKIGSRVHVHKSQETLYDFISKDILPADLGGREIPLQELNDKWMDVLNKEENVRFFQEISEASTDEALRPKSAHDEPYMGMVGSFRSLSVD